MTAQATAAAEMILNSLNGIAVMLAHTQDAEMSLTEQVLILPPLAAILAKPTLMARVSSNAPYVALVVGFGMWGSRVAQLRQGSRPLPMPDPLAMQTDGQPLSDESLNGHVTMTDTGPIWNELQAIRVG